MSACGYLYFVLCGYLEGTLGDLVGTLGVPWGCLDVPWGGGGLMCTFVCSSEYLCFLFGVVPSWSSLV